MSFSLTHVPPLYIVRLSDGGAVWELAYTQIGGPFFHHAALAVPKAKGACPPYLPPHVSNVPVRLHWAAPKLFNKTRHSSGLALRDGVSRPLNIERPCIRPRLAADDDPVEF